MRYNMTMKRSLDVSLPLIAMTIGVAGAGIAGGLTQNHRDCVDQTTGQVVHASSCDAAYTRGYIGSPYAYRYSNGDGSTSIVNAGDRASVSTRGGFGASAGGGDTIGGHSSGS
jgi:hypothetical protein